MVEPKSDAQAHSHLQMMEECGHPGFPLEGRFKAILKICMLLRLVVVLDWPKRSFIFFYKVALVALSCF